MMLRVVLLSCFLSTLINGLVIETDQGVLNGTVRTSRNGYYFLAFYGIPYAQPPVGELRFEPPQIPAPSWLGIREATEEPPVCPQLDMFVTKTYAGSEDCLFLNVYTHNVNPTTSAPVLVFFHGGGFSTGSGTITGPQYFMDKPVVVVTVNSRLGIFGFFSTGDSVNSGNYGLKDQVAALIWIEQNIRAFGGDPKAVTIMGQSSGAGSVHLHTLSTLSNGLFHRVIIHSGAANHPVSFTPTEQAQQRFWEFATHTSCLGSTVHESVACLKTIPRDMLKYAEETFARRNFMNRFRPVIEHPNSEGAFLTTNPLKHKYTMHVPMIIGFTSNEGGNFNPEAQALLEARDDIDLYALLPERLHYRMPEYPNLEFELTTLIKRYYFGDNLEYLNPVSVSQLLSDIKFKMGIVEAIKEYPGVKYAFEYDYRSPEQLDSGAPHTSDLRSLFPFKYNPNDQLSEEQRWVSEIMITYWTNFVATGNPNSPDTRLPVRWDRVKTRSAEFLHISNYGFEMEKDATRGKAELFNLYQKVLRLRSQPFEPALSL